MDITSFYFLCFFGITLLLYYILPKKAQWAFLLLVSGLFFVTYGKPWLILYPILSTMVTFVGANLIERLEEQKRKKAVLSFVVVFQLVLLVVLKYLNFGVYTHNAIMDVFHIGGSTGTDSVLWCHWVYLSIHCR